MSAISNTKTSIAFFITGAWLLVSALQTLHFYYYFDQTLSNSLYWSLRDWFVWFALFASIFLIVRNFICFERFTLKTLAVAVTMALVAGVLQILIITSIDFIQGSATRPFWVDFCHFYNKRWFQYLLVFSVFWMAMTLFLSTSKLRTDTHSSEKVKLNDGRQSYWLNRLDIDSVIAAGNYVSVHHGNQETVIRSTIKDMHKHLGKEHFLRVSRSALVNVSSVSACKRLSRNRLELTLRSGRVVKVGATYQAAVAEIF